jgi:GrpB-like predicted nucleotidyltransferase (UPF0157 family)
MKLVGRFIEFDPNEAGIPIEFYRDVFSRWNQIDHVRLPVRHIGYECSIATAHHLAFIGFEVESFGAFPGDFRGLELSDGKIAFTAPGNGHGNTCGETSVEWTWKNSLHTHGKHWPVGDFSFDMAVLPGLGLHGIHEMWMSFNIFGSEEIEGGDTIEIVDYSQDWHPAFVSFRSFLLQTFPSQVLKRIEHIGSTAIPGLPAKPIIDLLIEVPDFSTAREALVPLLTDESWEYCWHNHHFMLIKREKYKGKRTHHLHFVTEGHPQWRSASFRNYLRENPVKAAEYAALKKKLAIEFRNDRERYTAEKSSFITAVTDEAVGKAY